ncbi:sensor histidine kinase [Cellulomonas bogoriensis]|uniref:Histidine kinase n=1 Tax=Cellulomonas bogoriensis 69B4 = DSM 16987 TaxID=1386082 RepID=A0A0A0C150_9CELL|nr:histidine kinase [Cellulomonas bogoriensis]KGM13119.1 histidine kinase [Cellulomonas bogoriensis 69B4 = DSM 16987]
MERTGPAQVGAGIAMLGLCLVIGGVEGGSLVTGGVGTAYLAVWVVVFVTYLAATTYASVRRTPEGATGRWALVAPSVLAAGVLVLLSPNRGGLVLILVVVAAAMSALHLDLRGVAAVIAWNSVVVASSSAAVGPLVPDPNPPAEVALVTVLYALLQAGSAAMMWAQQRISRALQDVTVAHVELRSTSALLAESSQAQERLRISRELHDVLGHQLTVLAVELEVASHKTDGPAREHVLRARGLAKDLLSDVRAAVGTERGRSFDLPGALARVVDGVPHPQVHLELDPGVRIDDDGAATLVRVAQEVTTNTIRHAEANHLWLTVTAEDGVVRFTARDDGTGARRVVPGNGLDGVRERIESRGGRLRLDGSDGFRVDAELPTAAGALL